MEIANVHFTVTCQYPLSADRLPETYRQFIKNSVSPGEDINVNVRIETGMMPDTGRMLKIFDTGQTWSIYRQDNNYIVSFSFPTTQGKPLWIAVFDINCNNISLYCSDLLMNNINGRTTFSYPLSYPLDQILIMYILSGKSGALIHAAGLGMAGRGYIFPGKSGAGKSTLSRLLLDRNNISMLSDDRIIIRKIEDRFMAFGTPWAGDAGIAENKSVILDRIFFIHHAEANMIKELKPIEAVKRLMPVTSILWHDEKATQNMLAFCEDLVMNIPAYELHFRPDREVASFIEDFISKNRV